MFRTTLPFVLVSLAIFIAGCSGSGNPVDSPVSCPAISQSGMASGSSSLHGRLIWGMWRIAVSVDPTDVQVIPDRTASMHFNTVRLLEVAPCTTCLEISNVVLSPPDILTADITLRHPFPGMPEFTGFDVRGIFITKADYLFPISGRSVAWSGSTGPLLLNSDGYTSLFNPTEFPEGSPGPPALRYIPGKFSTGGDLNARLNPFIAYGHEQPYWQRRIFYAGSAETRSIEIRLPGGPFEFGYAVDASWVPVGDVTDPLSDFPPEANCMEAYKIRAELQSELGGEAGTTAPIDVTVWDHQFGTISSVTLESPELFSGEIALDLWGVSDSDQFLYRGTVVNEVGAGEGRYPILLKVTDIVEDPHFGAVNAYQVYDANVGGTPAQGGWARIWGEDFSDTVIGSQVEQCPAGYLYVAGYYGGSGCTEPIDFDPGPGTDMHTGCGHFISKFDKSGDFIWALTIENDVGGPPNALAVDGLGNIYLSGEFADPVDFDPGPGVETRTPIKGGDIYLASYTAAGDFRWVSAWGAYDAPDVWASEMSFGAACDSANNVYVVGHFETTIDFDPGPGVDDHTSNGGLDIFLTKFNEYGDYLWAKTWGSPHEENGSEMDWARDVAVDASDYIYVTGTFNHTCDFDPGPGVDEHSSNLTGDNPYDMFLSKFDTDGLYQWGRSWGGDGAQDNCYSVSPHNAGFIYVSGTYDGSADFDPGAGIDIHTSYAWEDGFVSKFNASGDFLWARTWGGTDSGVVPWDVVADSTGSVCMTGWFYGTVDFDPGSGVDEHTTGTRDFQFCFLSRLTSGGDFLWARTWEAGDYGMRTYGYSITSDVNQNLYFAGYSEDLDDLDPGPGTDYQEGLNCGFIIKVLPNGYWN